MDIGSDHRKRLLGRHLACRQAVILLTIFAAGALVASAFDAAARAQSGRVRDNEKPPSIATPPDRPFVSVEGKFTIALPERFTSHHPIKIQGDIATIAGDSFEWETAEGKFTVFYLDTPALIGGSAGANAGLDQFREQTLKQIANSKGTILSDRDILVSGIPGAEIKADMSGFLYTFRGCLTGRRLYEWRVAIPKNATPDLASTDRVMDSFRLIPEGGPAGNKYR